MPFWLILGLVINLLQEPRSALKRMVKRMCDLDDRLVKLDLGDVDPGTELPWDEHRSLIHDMAVMVPANIVFVIDGFEKVLHETTRSMFIEFLKTLSEIMASKAMHERTLKVLFTSSCDCPPLRNNLDGDRFSFKD